MNSNSRSSAVKNLRKRKQPKKNINEQLQNLEMDENDGACKKSKKSQEGKVLPTVSDSESGNDMIDEYDENDDEYNPEDDIEGDDGNDDDGDDDSHSDSNDSGDDDAENDEKKIPEADPPENLNKKGVKKQTTKKKAAASVIDDKVLNVTVSLLSILKYDII